MCVFDLPETVLNVNCHFTALLGSVCYLGNFMAERTVLAEKVAADLHIKKCLYMIFRYKFSSNMNFPLSPQLS